MLSSVPRGKCKLCECERRRSSFQFDLVDEIKFFRPKIKCVFFPSSVLGSWMEVEGACAYFIIRFFLSWFSFCCWLISWQLPHIRCDGGFSHAKHQSSMKLVSHHHRFSIFNNNSLHSLVWTKPFALAISRTQSVAGSKFRIADEKKNVRANEKGISDRESL